MQITKRSKLRRMIIALSAYSVLYLCSIWSSQRSFSTNLCAPVKECPEGEERYFKTHPDIAKKWKPTRTAYLHWKNFGRAEGRNYYCNCDNYEDKDRSLSYKKTHGKSIFMQKNFFCRLFRFFM